MSSNHKTSSQTPIAKIFFILLLTFTLQSIQAQITQNKGVFASGLHANVRAFSTGSYTHYDQLPITGFSLGAIQEFAYKDLIHLNSRLGFSQGGFEARQFIQVLEDTPELYREELWSVFRLNSIFLESGIRLEWNKLSIGTNFRFAYLLWASEQQQSLFLTSLDVFFVGELKNIIEEPQARQKADFNKIDYGFHYYIGAKLFKKCYLEIGLYQGLPPIRDPKQYKDYYQILSFDLGFTYFF